MIDEDKVVERKLLLKRTFPLPSLFEIGRELNVPYFREFVSCWEIDEDEAALEIAMNVSDAKLKKLYGKYAPRDWVTFRGKYYTFENGTLRLAGSWDKLKAKISEAKKKYGKSCIFVLNEMVRSGGTFGLEEARQALKNGVNPYPILADLERLKVVAPSYKGEKYQEWRIPDEILPLVQQEVGTPQEPTPAAAPVTAEKVDYVAEERRKVEAMDQELANYLNDLIKHRLEQTIQFGKAFSVCELADYLKRMFGSILYFDSFLSIIQQYGLADVEIVNPQGKTGMRTGWSLALFGEPGTGKSFPTRDMILGKPDGKIMPHGIPGRNRYCGGMTPAHFIRIGQAYAGRTFNFIVPEFNDWFKAPGMVEILKVAMERGEIKYELHREVIGPYRFDSYFCVNYNTKVLGRGYEVTIADPNFSLPYEEVVLVCGSDGYEFKKIGELVESPPREVKVASFNPETLQIELCKVTGFFKHPPSRIYEVRLRSGRRVRVTAGHSLFSVSRGGEIRPVPTKHLKPGDFIAIPRRLPPSPKQLTRLNVAELLVKKGMHSRVFIRDSSVQRIILRNANPSLMDFSRRVNRPYTTVCHWKKRSVMPLELYAKFDSQFSGLSPDATLHHDRSRKSFPATLNLDEEFAWFLGFYLAEGEIHQRRYVRLGTKNESHAHKVIRFAETLGAKASYDGKVVTINSVMLAKLLEALGIGRNSHQKRVPSIVFNLPANSIKAFINGYVAGDGYLNKKRGEITAATVSKDLPSDEMYLMYTLRKIVRATPVKEATHVVTPKRGGLFDHLPSILVGRLVRDLRKKSGLSQRAFVSILNNAISRSCLAEIETCYHKRVKRSAVIRLIEALPDDLKDAEEAKILKALALGDIAWDEVEEIVDTGREEPTYDLEVRPEGRNIENFIGGYGGIFLHNSAIEDRMICRLHRLTKERFVEIAESQMRLALGEIDLDRGARSIRDHVTLIYAIETGHPLVRGLFPYKPVMITAETYKMIQRAREAILEQIPQESLKFSARLENHAIRFACAASLLNYFHSDLDYIPVSEDAVKYAVKLYVEEASVRSREEFSPDEVLDKLFG